MLEIIWSLKRRWRLQKFQVFQSYEIIQSFAFLYITFEFHVCVIYSFMHWKITVKKDVRTFSEVKKKNPCDDIFFWLLKRKECHHFLLGLHKKLSPLWKLLLYTKGEMKKKWNNFGTYLNIQHSKEKKNIKYYSL